MNAGIDLCLMVKNEEKYIERCIKSVLSYVADIYILDTGSTDKTIDIARKYTENIFFKKFNGNFAQMRYEIMKKAKSEWILFLDADEYFEKYDINQVIKLIKNLPQDIGGIRFYRYNFFANGGWYTDHIVKMFRNYKGFKYDKNVTEKIEHSIEEEYKIYEPDIILNHTGHCKSRESRDKKTEIYISLLKKQLEITPDDALLHSYIGINSGNIGDLHTALKETELGVKLNPKGVVNHIFYGNILRAMNKPAKAIEEYKIALKLDNKKSTRTKNLLGVTYLSMGNFTEAAKQLKDAYEQNEILIHILLNVGLTYFFMEDYKSALECFNIVKKRDKAFMNYDLHTLLETNYCDCLSYETISNYAGLRFYIDTCKINI